ncbi:MAG: 2-dehydro-3-deoxy-D-gluconate 5-dehydrogenase KduD [Verrucomicrobiota bacterium]
MILDSFSLAGKTAIVTGASRGLGQAMAIGLAEAGANIIAVSSTPADETAAAVRALGGECSVEVCDLGDRAAVKALMPSIIAAGKQPDILVNCAGIIRRNDFTDFTEADWDDVMGVNLDAAFFLSQAFVKNLLDRKSKGKIIHIASMLSFQGGIRVPSYTASKSALQGLTRLMACELAAKGINVNAIAPGYMATDNTAPLRADEKRNAAILERIPVGHWGRPEDLKGAVVFLASAASNYMHGHTLAVDGGWLAR